eukprot:655604-Hanusia_phi.AAC.1
MPKFGISADPVKAAMLANASSSLSQPFFLPDALFSPPSSLLLPSTKEANDRWVEGDRPWRNRMAELGEDRQEEEGERREEVSRRAVRLSVRVEQKQEEEAGENRNGNESSPISPWKLRWNAAIRSLEKRASRVGSVKRPSQKLFLSPQSNNEALTPVKDAQVQVKQGSRHVRSKSAPPSKEVSKDAPRERKKQKKLRTKSNSPRKARGKVHSVLSSREKGRQYYNKTEKEKHLKVCPCCPSDPSSAIIPPTSYSLLPQPCLSASPNSQLLSPSSLQSPCSLLNHLSSLFLLTPPSALPPFRSSDQMAGAEYTGKKERRTGEAIAGTAGEVP